MRQNSGPTLRLIAGRALAAQAEYSDTPCDEDAASEEEGFSAFWLVSSDVGGVGRTTVAKCLARAVGDIGFRPVYLGVGTQDDDIPSWCTTMRIDHVREQDWLAVVRQKSLNTIIIADVGGAVKGDPLRQLISEADVVVTPVPDAADARAVSAVIRSAHRVRETVDWTYGECSARHYTLLLGSGRYETDGIDQYLPLPLDADEYPYVDPTAAAFIGEQADFTKCDRQSAFSLRKRLADVPTCILTSTIPQALLFPPGEDQSWRDHPDGRFGQKSYKRLARELLLQSDGRLVPDPIRKTAPRERG